MVVPGPPKTDPHAEFSVSCLEERYGTAHPSVRSGATPLGAVTSWRVCSIENKKGVNWMDFDAVAKDTAAPAA